jgi:GAF domain-containing protein
MTPPAERAPRLLDVLVRLADSLVSDFDVIELTDRLTSSCVQLLAVDAAGLVLSNPRGGLQVMTSTTEATHRLEMLQLRFEEGPCVEAYRRGEPVDVADLGDACARWPRFAPEALSAGFQAVHALPLRLREQTIGAMNLFSHEPGLLPAPDVRAGQALTAVATIAVLSHRTLYESQRLVGQLESALQSRIIIEQANGRLLERGNLPTVEVAFTHLRAYARRTNQRLTDVAEAIMNNNLDTTTILATQ